MNLCKKFFSLNSKLLLFKTLKNFLKLKAFSKFTISPICPPISLGFIDLIFSTKIEIASSQV